MTIEEIQLFENIEKIKSFLELSEDENLHIDITEHYSVVDQYVAFPIIVNTSYQTYEEETTTVEGITTITMLPTSIPIKDIQGTDIGNIFFSNHKQIVDESKISKEKYAAYLIDISNEDFANNIYRLNKDYLVISKAFLRDYLEKYKKSSILWGGFYHEDDKKVVDPIKQIKAQITCFPNLKLPTEFHHDNAQRAIVQPYAFERFLKNYHLLELYFDYQSVQEISKHHQNNDFQKAGDVLKKYDRKDIARLQYVIEKCNDMEKIASLINIGKNFQGILFDILYKYEKDNSALSDTDFSRIITEPSPFAIESFINHNIQEFKNKRNKKLQDFTCYCIYRIRSSIAHSKIGEFLLTSSNPEHEEFMVKFAEPLLQEVLIQCFKQNPIT